MSVVYAYTGAYTDRMNPPTCKTCGKTEWRHVCVGRQPTAPAKKAVAKQALRSVRPARTAPVTAIEAPDAASSRKEYLKIKARERRKRQHEARGKGL